MLLENKISDYKATSDGRYVIVQDRSGYVGVWDVADYSRIMLLESVRSYDVQLLSDIQMVLISDAGIISYDLSSGQELWRISDPDVN